MERLKLYITAIAICFLLTSCNHYEKGKQALLEKQLGTAQIEFTKASPNRNSLNKEEVEAANGLFIIQAIRAFGANGGPNLNDCISNTDSVSNGSEWKTMALALRATCDSIIRISDSTLQSKIIEQAQAKNYRSLFDLLTYRKFSTQQKYIDVVSSLPLSEKDLQQSNKKMELAIDELNRKILELNRKISYKTKQSDYCDRLMELYYANQRIYGRDFMPYRLEQAYDEVVQRSDHLEKEIEEIKAKIEDIEAKKAILLSERTAIENISMLLNRSRTPSEKIP